MDQLLSNLINNTNNILWSYIIIALLIAAGLYFSFRTRFVQLRYFKEMFKLLTEGTGSAKGTSHISSFQAFCISTASRVGTGNLAGVATAITVGGPGAIFWMWVIAIIGGASSFVESTLAQVYKVKDGENYRGGPAYYMERALGQRWMGILFSILITICFGLVFNSVQANTISQAFQKAFGIKTYITGAVIAFITAIIIFGGVKRIAKTAEAIVPVMAIAYVTVALFIVLKNITLIPSVFKMIFEGAFGVKQAVGGGIGAAIMMGIKRGLFSNEAGMGSAPNAAATAHTSHPAKQGLIQTLSVFTDTLLICSATAFIVLTSGEYTNPDVTGIQLTQNALVHHVGSWGSIFIAICIFLFAYSSVIGNYYYGETNIEFIKPSKTYLNIYRLLVVAMVMWGSIASLQIVWDLADLFMGLMAILNIIAILLLGNVAFKVLKDYEKQREEGFDPKFKARNIEGLKNADCWEE
ncbi:sodium:alanine symporter family protein [Caloramator sp. ALD01]|uniref:alanine/glycine:cation symporter family protein n=1 Tax=Caloramator sp. ALD01 TaxID=1031288 RepID=UPI000427949A|nr:alanine/glycine:cation symporter family protein [Caloramator sp. ALD01]